MKEIKINNWCIIPGPGNEYMAPEVREISIYGSVMNYPGKPNGTKIRTSRIINTKGRVVFTESGSKYILGSIEKEYRQWLRKNKPECDYKNPIKIL